MWNSYFYQLQNKYSMRVSTKEPLVIRLDGKSVTRSSEINILHEYEGGFVAAFKQVALYFTSKYHCLAILGSDEISFIFENPMDVINDLDSDKNTHSNEIVSMFTQYFFDYFNNMYNGDKIFWHAKCLSIPNGKIISYIKYRSGVIENVMTTYFLKRNNIKMGNVKMKDRLNECKKYADYSILDNVKNGLLFYNGNEINLAEFINNNQKVILHKQQKNTNSLENIEIDINIEI